MNFCVTKMHDIILAMKSDQTLSEAKGIFLVMDYKPNDLKQMISDIGPEDLKEIERRINDFLDRTETRLVRENGKKRPNLAELARAMFGDARAEQELTDRQRMRERAEKER